MGLTNQEIELLIRLRSDAEAGFSKLSDQLKRVTGETEKAGGATDRFERSQRQSQAAATATGVVIGNLATGLMTRLVGAFSSTVDAANRLDAGLIGLSSVARAFGGDADRAQAAARALAADGLMSVGEAATGLKNLLASGFNLDQATTLMLRFKDSASFGRQAALSFGQAVTSATEGIKNGNCLVAETPILTEGGRWVAIGDLYRSATPTKVYSLRADGSLRHTDVSHVVHNGRRPVFDLVLESGKVVRATSNHRFLSPEGWRFLQDLRPGDEVLTVNPAAGEPAVCPVGSNASTVGPSSSSSRGELQRLASAAVGVEAHGAVPTFAGRWRPIGGAVDGPAATWGRACDAVRQSSPNRDSARQVGRNIARPPVGTAHERSAWVRWRRAGRRAWRASVNGAARWWNGFLPSLARFGSAAGIAGLGGSLPYGWLAVTTPTGGEGGRRGSTASEARRRISAGASPSSGEIRVGARSQAVACASEAPIATRTTSCGSPTIPAAPWTSTTDARSAAPATSVYTLDRDRVRAILPAGEAEVYDLSVPETRNFIAGGVISHNSILVDNAGVTKNLSVILKEAGFAATDVSRATTDANVRLALFNGILKETNPQLGDAGRLLDTAAGKQAQFNAQVEIASAKIGKALQPVLTSTLNALIPLAEAVGDNAEVLTKLGLLAAAAAAPFVAMRAAAVLGLPTLKEMKTGIQGVTTAIRALTAAQTTQGLAAVSSELGTVGTMIARIRALLPAGAGLAGLFGLSAGGALAAGMAGYTAYTTQMAADLQRMEGFKALTAEASRVAGVQIKDIASAWQIVDKSFKDAEASGRTLTAEQLRLKDALVALNPYVGEQKNQFAALGDMYRKLKAEQEAQVPATEKMAAAMRQYSADVKRSLEATGLTVPQLTAALRDNENAFLAWAETAGLTKDALKFLQDTVKAQEAAQKESTKQTKDAAAALKQQEEAVRSLGLITQAGLTAELTKLGEAQRFATEQGGLSADVTRAALVPAYQELLATARAAGLDVTALARALTEAAAARDRVTQARFSALDWGIPDVVYSGLEGLPATFGKVTDAVQILTPETYRLQEAMRYYGVSSRDELQQTAQEAARHFEVLRASGTATPAQIAEAFARMRDAVNAANGDLPSYWAREVVPGITRTLETLQTAISGSFAQMALGAKSFGEGFTDIWQSIKASVLNIFNEIVNAFLHGVLKRIIGALNGQQGALSGGFQGLFGGLGGSAASFVPGGVAVGGQTALLTGSGATLLPTAGGGSFLGGGAAAGVAGGALAGGAGLGLGLLGKRFFGGAGTSAGLFGAGSGAAAGAAIGSVVPGIGTAIGALVGGLGGLVGGIFGQTKGQREGQAADASIAQMQAQLLETYGSLERIGELGRQVGVDLAGAWGDKNVAGLANFTSLTELFSTRVATLTGLLAEQAGVQAEIDALNAKMAPSYEQLAGLAEKYGVRTESLGAAFAQLGINDRAADLASAYETMVAGIDGVGGDVGGILFDMREEFSALVRESLRAGTAIPANLEPMIAELWKSGNLIDENGQKLESIQGIRFGEPVKTEAEIMRSAMQQLVDKLQILIDKIAGLPTAAGTAAGGVEDALNNIQVEPIRVPIEFDDGGGYQGGGSTIDIPGAANGILASRPTLRVFAEREPELGGSVSFMSKALAGALQRSGGFVAGAASHMRELVLRVGEREFGRIAFDALAPELQARGIVRR